MRLYCMRHGEAEMDIVDSHRCLTCHGQSDIKRIGEYVAKLKISVNHIFHSGLLRAEQTAKIMADCLPGKVQPESMPGLEDGSLVEPLADMIQHWQDDSLLVSHMPFISNLVSYLVTGQSHQAITAFPPGMLVMLERSRPGVWQLSLALSPSMVVSV